MSRTTSPRAIKFQYDSMTAMPNPAVNRTLRMKPREAGCFYVSHHNPPSTQTSVKPATR